MKDSLPVWNTLSSNVLLNDGWIKVGKLYIKENNTIEYTGVHWILNGKTRIEFLQEIKEQLNNKK